MPRRTSSIRWDRNDETLHPGSRLNERADRRQSQFRDVTSNIGATMKRNGVCVCVCVGERGRERERVCVFTCTRVCMCGYDAVLAQQQPVLSLQVPDLQTEWHVGLALLGTTRMHAIDTISISSTRFASSSTISAEARLACAVNLGKATLM